MMFSHSNVATPFAFDKCPILQSLVSGTMLCRKLHFLKSTLGFFLYLYLEKPNMDVSI